MKHNVKFGKCRKEAAAGYGSVWKVRRVVGPLFAWHPREQLPIFGMATRESGVQTGVYKQHQITDFMCIVQPSIFLSH